MPLAFLLLGLGRADRVRGLVRSGLGSGGRMNDVPAPTLDLEHLHIFAGWED